MNDFHERLARIESGSTTNRHTLFVGMDESYVIAPRLKTKQSATAISNFGYGLGRIWAICLGGLAVIILEVARFWLGLNEPLPGDPINDQVVTGVVALMIAIYLGRKMFTDREGLIGLHSTGALIMTVGMHNFVHAAPHLFELISSPLWVAEVLGSAEPYSVLVRGVSIPFL
ncbi:hypothetical protein ACSBLW_03985 [Thioclava sp. FR2]|uniref:hypothetical protein n=1 Tax=Thioclava sp. FR2 TaxID=3445780 RepID=UPI003EBD600C